MQQHQGLSQGQQAGQEEQKRYSGAAPLQVTVLF
jgi:hypothetical protein